MGAIHGFLPVRASRVHSLGRARPRHWRLLHRWQYLRTVSWTASATLDNLDRNGPINHSGIGAGGSNRLEEDLVCE